MLPQKEANLVLPSRKDSRNKGQQYRLQFLHDKFEANRP